MQKIINAVGAGKKDDSEANETGGVEPVSGETGAGTTAEPFDEGNQKAATESAVQDREQGLDSTANTAGSNQAEHTTGGTASAQKDSKTSFIKNPFSKSKDEDSTNTDNQATSGAEQLNKAEDDSSRPPNELGSNIPPGASTDLADRSTTMSSQPDDKPAMAAESTSNAVGGQTTQATTSNTGAPQINFPPSNEEMRSGSTGGGQSQLKASRAYSVASPAADKSRRAPIKANNPGSIPTAGGKAIGGEAMADRQRRKSQWSSEDQMAALDKEGSPDERIQGNTAANTTTGTVLPDVGGNGEGSSKVDESKPEFNQSMFGAGEEPKKVENEAPVVPASSTTTESKSAVDSKATDESKTTSDSKGPVEKAKDVAKDVKERRGSKIGRLFGKKN